MKYDTMFVCFAKFTLIKEHSFGRWQGDSVEPIPAFVPLPSAPSGTKAGKLTCAAGPSPRCAVRAAGIALLGQSGRAVGPLA